MQTDVNCVELPIGNTGLFSPKLLELLLYYKVANYPNLYFRANSIISKLW